MIRTARGTNRSIRFNSGAHSFDDWQLSAGENGGAVAAIIRLSAGQSRPVSVGRPAPAAGRPVCWPVGPCRARFARRSRSVHCEHLAPIAFCDGAFPNASRKGGRSGKGCCGGAVGPLVERRAAGEAGSGLRIGRWRAARTAVPRPWRVAPWAGFAVVGRENSPAVSATAERGSRERFRLTGQPVVIRFARPGSFSPTKGNE